MDESRAITVANDDTLIELVQRAESRLVLLAPAVSMRVSAVVCQRWKELGRAHVNVTLDVDPEVYRLGYGEIKGLEMLEQTARELGTMLQRQPGIRIGLLIADDAMLVYSPTPLLIEASPTSQDRLKPNAILLQSTSPQVVQELGQGENGVKDQKIGLDKAQIAAIRQVQEDLAKNPVQKFDIARKVRVFNAAFEFVEFELLGTFIDRRTVQIPKHLSGITDEKTRRQLQQSFRILPSESKLSGEHLKKDRDLIAKKYLRSIRDYGTVVLRAEKHAFSKEVESLRTAVTEFSEKVKSELQAEMDRNRKALLESMLPMVERTPPEQWSTSDGRRPDGPTIKRFLEDDLRRAFGTAERLVKNMQVRLVFKGVTYESLSNGEFLVAARAAIPELDKMYEEFDAARGRDQDEEEMDDAL